MAPTNDPAGSAAYVADAGRRSDTYGPTLTPVVMDRFPVVLYACDECRALVAPVHLEEHSRWHLTARKEG